MTKTVSMTDDIRGFANNARLHPDGNEEGILVRRSVVLAWADEIEQLSGLLRRFMDCRSESGTGWKVAAGANAGDALNKVYLAAKKHFAGSPDEPSDGRTEKIKGEHHD